MSKVLIRDLVKSKVIEAPMDGNHGELHPTAKDYVPTGIPFLMATDIENGVVNFQSCKYISQETASTLRKGFAKEGDILLTHKATIGRTAILKQMQTPYAVLTPQVTYYRICQQDILDSMYLKYYFDTPEFQYIIKKRAGAGSTRAYIGITEQQTLSVKIIDIEMQRNISKTLFALDSKIENNYKIAAELETMAKTIYDYWFLQFDFPDENGRPYKSSGGKMVWNKELKREIPEGWSISTVKQCIQHINTGLNPRDNFKLGNGTIKYITVKNLTTKGTIDFAGCDVIDETARKIVHNRSDVSKNDILFASIAPLGRCCIVQEAPSDWDINESVFCIRPDLKKVSSAYLYQFFMNDSFIKKAEHSSTGSVFSGIRIGVLEGMKLIVPPAVIMKKFTDAVSNALYLKYKSEQENQELTSLRDFLLPLLMNGQVTIKNAIPAESRTTEDSLSYGMQLVFSALQQSNGYLPLNTLADMFAILGSSKEMQKMLPESDEKTAWSKNLPNLSINDTLLVETIDELIKWGLLGLRTVNGVRELLLIGDWPIDKVDDPWIEVDAMLAKQAINDWDERLRVKNQRVLRFREILNNKQYIAA